MTRSTSQDPPKSALAKTFLASHGTPKMSLEEEPESVPVPHWPSPIAPAAYHGLAGDVVRVLAPHSEADPAALLVQFLAAAGNYIGRIPHFLIEGDRHYCNLFVLLTGPSATGRKGASWGQVRRVLAATDPAYVRANIKGGLATGEGLIYHVRDAAPKSFVQPAVGGGGFASDAGVVDKRLLALETEFASALRVMARDGNTLSARIRQAWDTGNLSTLTRGEPLTATDAHITIVAHITPDELRRRLGDEQLVNGFANRFLFVAVRRSQYLPHGSDPDPAAVGDLATRLRAVREHYVRLAVPTRLERDGDTRVAWEHCYRALADGSPGLVGAVTSRAAAQVMRLASIYAALDCSAVITERHLDAARAIWAYSVDSAGYVFGDKLGDEGVERVHAVLRAAPGWIARTTINRELAGHVSSAEIARSLRALQEMRRAAMKLSPTPGRPAEMWCDADKAEKAKQGQHSHPGLAVETPSSACSAFPATPTGFNRTTVRRLDADAGIQR